MTNSNEQPDPASWVDSFGDYLFGFAMQRVRDKALAEDLVQDTLLAALKSRGTFGGRSAFSTWLVGILKRKIIDHFRTLEKEGTDGSPLPFEREGLFLTEGEWMDHWDPAHAPGEWADDAHDLYERQEFRAILDNCMMGLPKRLAAAFSMREIDGLDTGEICKVLEISPTNLWVMLHRSRMQLRRCIEINWLDRL